MCHTQCTSQLAADLLIPCASDVEPPVTTRIQELPFKSLSWKDFERLCVRLILRQSDIDECREYGVQGDEQEGIDLLARERATGSYRVYQCKREKDFGPAKIRDAVGAFLKGEWRNKTTAFHLCTMESLAPRIRASELEQQRGCLGSLGITLETWDTNGLNTVLKSHPDIVDDFFGRPWVRAFCGDQAAETLGYRLDKTEVRVLRARLGTLYYHVFREQDPMLSFRDPAKDSNQQFAIPDVIAYCDTNVPQDGPPPTQSRQRISDSSWWERDDDIVQPLEYYAEVSPELEQREDVTTWMTKGNRSLLLGGPGSGKSTLLRATVLDLLSNSPEWSSLARKWGNYLPIWLPFARWTALLAAGTVGQVSLKDFMSEWMRTQSAEDLVPLLEKAIDDKRLLLLVDGLDEWQTEQAARNAMSMLGSFVACHDVPIVATSRPRGRSVAGQIGSDWQVAQLAPLSNDQQVLMAKGVLYREKCSRGSTTLEDASRSAQLFLKDIGRRTELAEISRTPLLLGLLAQLWLRDADLPENRFNAYSKVIDNLLVTHPSRRKTAALVESAEVIPSDILRRAMAALALWILEQSPSGSLAKTEALRVLEAFLSDDTDGLALEPREAKAKARQVVEFAADSAALLVNTSPSEIGFYHRALLEFLAAEALATKPIKTQRQVVHTRVGCSIWHEVLLALIARTNRREDVQALVDEIGASSPTCVDKILTLPLLAGVAFGIPSCPPRTANDIAERVLGEVESGDYMPLRRRLLEPALRGIRLGPTQSKVRSRIERWLPRRFEFRSVIYKEMRNWPREQATIQCLFRGLRDERVSESLAAASALANLARNDSTFLDEVVKVATSSASLQVRASLLCGLVGEGIEVLPRTSEQIVGRHPYGDLACANLRVRVAQKLQTFADLSVAVMLGSIGGGLSFEWRDQIADLLVKGWPSEDKLRRLAHASLERWGSTDWDRNSLDHEIARKVLIQGYATDPASEQLLASEFATEFGPLDRRAWPLYAQFCRESAPITSAMDAWLARVKYNEVNAHWAALTSRSPQAKAAMLSALDGGAPWWAARALLEGWGMFDEEAAHALTAVANGPIRKAAQIAEFLPRILPDKDVCRKRLLELLEDGRFRDFVVRGLAELRDGSSDTDVATAIIAAVGDEKFSSWGRCMPLLIAHWSDDPRIESLAHRELDTLEGNAWSAAVAARTYPAIRATILQKVGVLPAPLRVTAAERLAEGLERQVTKTLFAQSKHEMHPSVRTQCVISRSIVHPEDMIVDELCEEAAAKGSTMNATREAAFCGLVSTGQVGRFAKMRERDESTDAMVSVRLGWSGRFNMPLFRCIADHWSALKEQFGETLEMRLEGSEPTGKLWEGIAGFARPGTDLARDILAYTDTLPPERFSVNLLRFVQRARPKSGRLLDVCLALTNPEAKRIPFWPEEPIVVACQILGTEFHGDAEVLNKLISPTFPKEVSTGQLLALCIGWPESDALRAIFEHLVSTSPNLPYIAYGSVVATKSAPDRVGDLFEVHADPYERHTAWEVTAVTKLLLRRLRTNDDAVAISTNRLQSMSEPACASALRLLVEARGLSPELEQQIRQRAEPGVAGTVAPVIGIDPMTGRECATWQTLVDGLFNQ